MNAEQEKDLYERLGSLYGALDFGGDREDFTEMLFAILGLSYETTRQHGGMWVRNPDDEAAADRVVRRWLKDREFMTT